MGEGFIPNPRLHSVEVKVEVKVKVGVGGGAGFLGLFTKIGC